MAKAPSNGPLNSAQLAELARATLDNAMSLLADAHLLLDAGRWPRAYALAVLAAEEYGKFEACVVASSYEQTDEESWTQFWGNFVLHKPKLTTWAGTLVDFLFTLPTMDHEEWINAWNKRGEVVQEGLRGKLSAFYVDFVDGKVSDPAALFTKEVAAETVALINFVVSIQARSFQGDLTRLVSSPAELRAVFGDMQRAKTAADRSVATQALLRFMERTLPTVDLSRLRAAAAQTRVQAAPEGR